MNHKQIARCIQRTDRNYVIIADCIRNDGCPISLKMGGYKSRISHRRVKAAMQAAKRHLQCSAVLFRDSGTLITPEVAAEWQQHTAADGHWWPGLAAWAKKAAKTAAKINGMGE